MRTAISCHQPDQRQSLQRNRQRPRYRFEICLQLRRRRANQCLDGNGTYYYKFATQNPDGSWTGQIDKGLTTVSGVISRWRHSLSLVYDIGNWDASLTQHFQKGYHDANGNVLGKNAMRNVGVYDTFDGQLSYRLATAWTFTAGVFNIGNANPPYANYASSANNFVGGYDLAYGDPRGRFVYGRVEFQFH